MTTIGEFNQYGEELEKLLHLRTSPIAIKLLEKEEDIPVGAIRPKKDRNVHIALCQAFAMARRQGESIAMMKEDHWCWAPLIGLGLVECEEGSESYREVVQKIFVENKEKGEKLFAKSFPRLEYGKYAGLVCAPLKTANFEPDMVMIYSNPAQLRSMLWGVKFKTASLLTSEFDPIDSCVYSTVPVILNGQYRITLPDPGEYERALAGEDEIIFSVPKDKMEELIEGLKHFEKIKFGYKQLTMEMRPDYPRPEFYNKVFKMWGLEEGELWKKH